MKTKPKPPEIIELDAQAVGEIQQRIAARQLSERDYEIFAAILATYYFLVNLLTQKKISIARLKKLLFGARTETTEAVLGSAAEATLPAESGQPGEAPGDDGSERRGIFTSGIVSTCAGQRIALFFTGRKHAGENLSPEARLQFHKDQRGPVMDDLNAWLQRQIGDRLVEPNSGLGEAITYLLKRWGKFTLFLRQPGAPLDNNLCERALKKVILHRKNAMFYKTENGAHAGDLYMSLIYTCELCGANPFDYLTELQRHAGEVAANPACWMPWNYRQTLAVVPAATSPAATATSDLLASVP